MMHACSSVLYEVGCKGIYAALANMMITLPLFAFALTFARAGISATAAVNEQVASGWAPVDGYGVRRHAAIGIFSNLTRVQATVQKYAANPLFKQDKPWETRIDNGYPNVVYDADIEGDGPWRLWYGNIGDGGQYLLYANSSDGLSWEKR